MFLAWDLMKESTNDYLSIFDQWHKRVAVALGTVWTPHLPRRLQLSPMPGSLDHAPQYLPQFVLEDRSAPFMDLPIEGPAQRLAARMQEMAAKFPSFKACCDPIDTSQLQYLVHGIFCCVIGMVLLPMVHTALAASLPFWDQRQTRSVCASSLSGLQTVLLLHQPQTQTRA